MVIQCKNLISLYILPDQRRGNLLVSDIFDLISALKSSSFNKNMIISMSFRGIHVLEYVKTFFENFSE